MEEKDSSVLKPMDENRGCRYQGNVYSHGSEFCIDIYCFRCMNGELHPYSGVFPG